MGRIQKLNPAKGLIEKETLLDAAAINGFVFDADFLWTVSSTGVKRLSQKDGTRIQQFGFERQVQMPVGLALVGGSLYVADRKANKIHEINPDNGKIVGEIPAPSADITGLAAFGGYVLVADGNDKAVYLVTEDGYVILRVELDAAPLGIA
ncbi:MAG: hypothetical protein HQ567_06270, partial [Candidatus Nealsonbacteria bacterium]|nr:hypothetical protein [Candidatus Nealsonbacteria bacterium]